MFQDYIFFAVDTPVYYSFRMAHVSRLVKDAQERHGLSLHRALFLGDALVGTLLLASLLDYGEQINVRLHCGEHFSIGCEATYEGVIRGYIDCSPGSAV
ncbi:MAG: Hsp33 family molecular chaperone HslO, partial [bacterium]